MPAEARTKTAPVDPASYHGLDRDTLIRIYRMMFLSRRLDDREIQLKRLNKLFFQISGAGHEAVLVAAGLALKPGHDWFYPYYRDRALCLTLGVTPYEMLLQGVGSKDDPSSAGRQMPSHWGHQDLNIVSQSSPTGTQWIQAVGAAEAALYYSQFPNALDEARRAPLGEAIRHEPDEVVYVSGGDGTTSEGEFWEALNSAAVKKTPVLFLVEDNGYAISVPVDQHTAGGNISHLLRNFPNFHIGECDGTDPLESYAVLREAVAHCRARKGPALVHAHVVRPYSHSMSDDEKLYKPAEVREEEAQRDPLPKFGLFLLREGILSEKQLEKIEAEVDRELRDAADRALAAELPEPESVKLWVYSPDVDPTSDAFASEPRLSGNEKTMVEMVSATLMDEMGRDERIVVFGEDVADCQPRRKSRKGEREGRRVQGHRGPAAPLRRAPRFQFAARRGEYRRPRHRHGDARAEAGGGNPVLRLHLAGDDAAARRAAAHAVALGGEIQVSGGGARRHRRLSFRRRDLSQPVRRIDFHARAGPARGDAVERARSFGPACARRFARTIRCSSSSTSICIASRTIARRIPDPITRCHSARRAWCARAPTPASSRMARWSIAPKWPRRSWNAKGFRSRSSICAR